MGAGVWLIAGDCFGMFIYLLLAMMSWGNPALPGSNGAGPFIWFFGAFPLLLAALAVNALIVLVRLVASLSNHTWEWLPSTGLVGVFWGVILLVDFSHHYS